MNHILTQLKEYYTMQGMPTGRSRVEVNDGVKQTQIQKLYTKRYADGTVTRALRWETVKEVA